MNKETKKPKVSICIPAYNQPVLLKRAIESILSQSFEDYEIVITDDTVDNSIEELIKSFNSSKIKYFKNTNKKSSTSNWSSSIEKASGEYIKIIHHDDWLTYDNSLEEFVKMLDENPEADFAFCVSKRSLTHENLGKYHIPPKKAVKKLRKNPFHLLFRNIIGAPSATIFRKKIKQKFDENLIYTVDWDFYTRVLCDNPNFVFTEKDLISINVESETQVTAKCIGNKDIHAYESFYMANKFKNQMKIREIVFLCNILYQYKIKSKNELSKIEIPNNFAFKAIMFLNKFGNTRYISKFILKTLYTITGEKFKEIELIS